MEVTSASASRAALTEYLRGQAEWRDEKAAEYPDDSRNRRAASMYLDLASRIEAGEFAGHPLFDVLDLWGVGMTHPQSLGRLGFDQREEPTEEFYNDLLHRAAVDEYVEAMDAHDAPDIAYLPDVLRELGYLDDDGHIVQTLPPCEEMVALLVDYDTKWTAEHPLEAAEEKAHAAHLALGGLLAFLDEPAVRKRVNKATEGEIKGLISELTTISTYASRTAGRLVERHPRMSYTR